jgi:hypothetical protein
VTTKFFVIFLSTPKINTSINMNYHSALRVAYIYQHFHSAYTHEFRITMFILQQNKHTIRELNQRISKIHKLIWGCLPPWVLACVGNGDGSARGRSSKRSGQGSSTSGGLRRTPASRAHGGELRRRWQVRRARERGKFRLGRK